MQPQPNPLAATIAPMQIQIQVQVATPVQPGRRTLHRGGYAIGG